MVFNRIVSLLGITSLKGRLRFWFICFLVLLVLLASFPFVILGKMQKREDAKIELEKMINLQQIVINNWFEEKLADIKSIAELPTFKEKDYKKMNEALEVFVNNHAEFSAMVYVNEAGKTEIDTSGPIGLDLSDRQYYKEAKKGDSYITDVLIGRQSNKPIVIISVPIYSYSGQFHGLVFGSVPITTIDKIMEQFQDSSRETYLVDREGMLITKSRQGEIGDTIYTEIYKHALTGNRVNKFYQTQNGDLVLGEYRWVHHQKWLIIGEIKGSNIYEPFYRMATAFSIVLVLLAILGYILIIWVSNQIEAPIRNVLIGTRKIGLGKFGYRLSRSDYRKDAKELQELSENFNNMAELIERHIDSIAKSEERFRMIAEYSSDMITIHDSTGKYLYVSPAGKEILQYDDKEVIGFDAYFFIHPDDIEMIRKSHEKLLKTGYVVSTYRIRRKDGEYIWLESSIKCLQAEHPGELQIIVISRNITERKMAELRLKEANRTLHELSTKDGLTGVWNRRTFDKQIEKEWKRALRELTPLSLIMFDVDYFKAYNDSYGHQAGDECLKALAARMNEILEMSRGMVFRYGGEEFSILLPKTDLAGAKVVAERIRKAVEKLSIPHRESQISNYVTMSFGISSTVPTNDNTITQFIGDADKALYNAKKDGRNCVRFYTNDKY
ncbi:diguanylate cyclase domain-containing protein [Bacillus sp. S/N-304-OC-R1]|uniref:diguanylate cyclase domain-containing protein n=1 Tax=Bacillus sp. S/N-304-OC-R1 TaxID=2758034 RepID=UPI001C8DCE11|nr:diguanylate cyclase [Bacillus sp. S/N-304-OC-R1]MBY0121776.1 diguanylate cyclase [Bacillus sp. S/N-304-OC-R1]